MPAKLTVPAFAAALVLLGPVFAPADGAAPVPLRRQPLRPVLVQPGPIGPLTPVPVGWVKLFEDEAWYKGQAGKEQLFRGKLEGVPGAGGPSTLQRTSYYRLRGRTIYTGAKKIDALDRLLGRQVEIRGKPVDMELEGQSLAEIWPAAVRSAGRGKKPQAGDKPNPKEPQGVTGHVGALKGNLMPSPSIGGVPGPRHGLGAPLAVPVHVFKGQVEPFEKLGPDRPKPLRTVQSNKKGVYRVALEPGEYTVVAEIKGKLYLNIVQFDAKTRKRAWASINVPKGKWVTWNIQDTSEAAF